MVQILYFLIIYTSFCAFAEIKINDPAVVNIKAREVTIEWTTTSKTRGVIEYGTTSKKIKTIEDHTVSIGHRVILPQLIPNSRYVFRIISKDEKGETKTSDLYSFKTERSDDEDQTILRLLAPPSVTLLSPYKAIISWETNKPSQGMVTYGFKHQKKPQIIYQEIETTAHMVTISNLIPNVRYFFQVSSKDTLGRQVSSTYSSFITKGHTKAQMLPKISQGPVIAVRKADEIKIEWSTDRPCKSYITWGKVPIKSFQKKIDVKNIYSLNHDIRFSDLKSGMRYYYVIHLEDLDGNKVTSEVFSVLLDHFY